MKKTELKGVYCVPKTDEELLLLNIDTRYATCGIKQCDKGLGTTLPDDEKILAEISVSKFLDLLEDRIVAWRLEEIGFEKIDNEQFQLSFDDCFISLLLPSCDIVLQSKYSMIPLNIKTFTELETLIRFLK